MVIQNILIFAVACLILVKSSQFAVKSIANIARSLKISEFITSFLIAGIISTFPEMFVGIVSALNGVSDIGWGTVIGANVADLTIVIGLVALIGGNIYVGSRTFKYDIFYIMLAALPIILAIDGNLSRLDGVVLIIICAVFLMHMIQESYRFHKIENKKGNRLFVNSLVFIASVTVLFFAANAVVEYALKLAIDFLVPEIFIGLVLISIGTTLPEFTFALRALKSGYGELAIGDILGNVIIDASLVIGIVAVINPIEISFLIVALTGFFMVLSMFMVITFLERDKGLTKKDAVMLIFIYILYLISNFFIKDIV